MSTCQARVVAAKACKPLPGDAPCQPILEDEDEDEDDADNVHDDAEGDVKSRDLGIYVLQERMDTDIQIAEII